MKTLLGDAARPLVLSLALTCGVLGCVDAGTAEDTEASEAAVKRRQSVANCAVANPPRGCRAYVAPPVAPTPTVNWEESKARLGRAFAVPLVVVKQIELPLDGKGKTTDDHFHGKLREPIVLDLSTKHDELDCTITADAQSEGEGATIPVGARYHLASAPETEFSWGPFGEDPEIDVKASFTIDPASRAEHDLAPETISLSCAWATTAFGSPMPWTSVYFEL